MAKKKKQESAKTDELIFGRNPVKDYLESGANVNKIFLGDGLKKDTKITTIIQLAKQNGIRFSYIPKNKLDKFSNNGNHQGVIAFVSPVSYYDVNDLLDYAKEKGEKPFILILDSIKDPHNFGAIIRTATATGVHGIIIPKHGSSPVTEVVVKTSAGTVTAIKIVRVGNLVNAINKLKDNDVWIYGADGTADKNFLETNFKGGVGLVMGSEGEGMHRLVKENCDFLVSIPMVGKVESLNVSVSAALLMYKVLESRI